MGARVRVFLNQEEERTLWELRSSTTVTQRVKDRAEAVRARTEKKLELRGHRVPRTLFKKRTENLQQRAIGGKTTPRTASELNS